MNANAEPTRHSFVLSDDGYAVEAAYHPRSGMVRVHDGPDSFSVPRHRRGQYARLFRELADWLEGLEAAPEGAGEPRQESLSLWEEL